jgi:hypothetical protein
MGATPPKAVSPTPAEPGGDRERERDQYYDRATRGEPVGEPTESGGRAIDQHLVDLTGKPIDDACADAVPDEESAATD